MFLNTQGVVKKELTNIYFDCIFFNQVLKLTAMCVKSPHLSVRLATSLETVVCFFSTTL